MHRTAQQFELFSYNNL